MYLIDRYLAWQFLRAFLIFFCSFTGLYVVIDFFGNMEEFLEYAEIRGNMALIVAEYYGYRVLSFFNLISGVLALISAMFTVTAFQRSNELTALMAAGISRRRVFTPIVATALGVSLLATINRELVVPTVRDQLSGNAQSLLGKTGRPLTPRYDNKTNIFLQGRSTFARDQRIEQPNFMLPRELDQYGTQLIADEAFYQRPGKERPGGYLLRGVSAPNNIAQRVSLKLEDEPIIIMPRDASWLAADECFVKSDVSFEQLQGGDTWRKFASTPELIMGLHNASLDFGANVRVAIHARLVQPLLDVTLLFLGLPLVLTRENRNAFVAIALCGLVVVGFMLSIMACHYLGSAYLIEPSRAAWLPLVLFVPAAVYLSQPLVSE